MPTLLILFGMRFFFYSNEHLPIHVHVINADEEAKFEVNPIRLIENKGIKAKDVKRAEIIIKEWQDEIIKKWHKLHG